MEVEMNGRNMNGMKEIDPFNVLGIEKGELPILPKLWINVLIKNIKKM